MALEIKNISTTINSVSCLFDIVPPVTHTNWSYSLSGGSYVLYSQTNGYRINCTITGLKENTTYTLRARAVNASTFVTVYSSTVSFTTKKSTTAPTVSASITAATAKGFTINGTANYPCRTWQYQIDGGAWQSLSATTSATSVSKVISGLTPGQTYSVRVRATRTYNGVTGTSGAVSAATLGASILNSVSTLTADDATAKVTFNVTIPAGTGFTHALYIYEGIDFLVGITTAQMAGVTSSGSHTVNLTGAQKNVLLARMPDRKSFNGRFYLVTFDGGTTIGNWSEKFATIQTTTANSAPTFTGFTHSEQNAKVTAVVAGAYYVQSLSDIKIVCTAATAKNGSSISKYGATIGAKTVTSGSTTIAFGAPAVCGIDYTISVYAEDSRGYKTTITDTKTIGCYAWPQVLEWQARRKDSVGEQTALYVLGQVQYSAGATLKMAEYRIQPSDGSYGAWTELTPTSVASTVGGKRTYLYDEDDWETLDPGKSYTVQIRVQDTFDEYSSTVTFPITRGTPVMSIRDGRIGINNFNPQAALDVIGDIHGDNIKWGVIESDSNASGRYMKFSDGTMICSHSKNFDVTIGTVWGGIYRSNTSLSLTFPVEFYATPTINAWVDGTYVAWLMHGGPPSKTSFSVLLLRGTSLPVATFTIRYIAIGRWKA